LRTFREIIIDKNLESFHSEAYYWIAKTHIAKNDLPNAGRYIEFFLSNYKTSAFYPDLFYQKGRIFFLENDYENCIQIMNLFLKQFPDDKLAANAWYWIAESLYESGYFPEAEKAFTHIVQNHPESFKIEAARYKLSLLEFQYKEQELLKFLRLSHEEYLKAIEEFQRREKTYEQAISNYQKKISAASSATDISIIIKQKDDEINRLKTELSGKDKALGQLTSDPASREIKNALNDMEKLKRLLAIKEEALNLKEYYIKWIESRPETGK
jgi:tetratricopeptide (TPR) repeat protein